MDPPTRAQGEGAPRVLPAPRRLALLLRPHPGLHGLIVFDWHLVRGEEPEIPAVWRALTEAADIPAALEQLRPERPDLSPITFEALFDIDALLERRELVVRPEALEMPPDLSEP